MKADEENKDEGEAPPPDLSADVVLVESLNQATEESNTEVAEGEEVEAPVVQAPPPPPISRKQLERDTNQLRAQAANILPAEAPMSQFDAHMACQTPMVFVSKRPAPAPMPMPVAPPPAPTVDNKFAKDVAAASGAVAQQQMWFLQSKQQAPEAAASWNMRQAMRRAGHATESGNSTPAP